MRKRQSTKVSLATFKPCASHRNCSTCGKKKPGVAFRQRSNVCIDCTRAKSRAVKRTTRDIYMKASGGKWWLYNYFVKAEKELRRISRGYSKM